MKRSLLLIVFFTITYLHSISQSSDFQGQLGTWNILSVRKDLNEKWEFYSEAQLRSLSFYNEFHYYEVKAGMQYNLDSVFSILAGGGSYNTYSPGDNFNLPIQNREIRSWIELRMKQQLKRLSFDHRYRAEQRFTSNGYRNRFRYRLSLTIPINNPEIKVGTYFFQGWNEIFFTDREPYFERNRLYVGGGYRLNKALTLQTGYIHQFDYNLNDEIGRDFFMMSFAFGL
ncbi:MAG: DUF2490 domain-containing protein [Flavobacteriales bacterium]|jgi:hypothetical protein